MVCGRIIGIALDLDNSKVIFTETEALQSIILSGI